MFDNKVIVDGSLKNRPAGGYSVRLRIPYYRGLGLSMVERLSLRVDGAETQPAALRFTVHGNEYTLGELPDAVDDRWGFTEDAELAVSAGDPLPPGEHEVEVGIGLRISYMPWPNVVVVRKTMPVTDDS
jgi:hypothetical protein